MITTANHVPAKPTIATWLGLFLSLFGMLVVRQVALTFWAAASMPAIAVREVGMWLVAVAILFIVRRCEGLSLRSIGLGTARWWRSILWGFIVAVICLAVAGVLMKLIGHHGGESGKAFERLPLWMLGLIVARAGVVEEICYRGYAMERLQAVGLPGWLAAVVPLLFSGSRIGLVAGRTSRSRLHSVASWRCSTFGGAILFPISWVTSWLISSA